MDTDMTNNLDITSNFQPRLLLSWEELTPDEQAEHDYTMAEEDSFFRYKGQVYALSEFTTAPPAMGVGRQPWHGVHPDSFFSGILLRLTDDADRVVVGYYTC